MSNKTFTVPNQNTPGGSGGGSGTVTSVTFTGDGTVLSSTPSSAVTTSGTLPATLNNANANTVLGNATGSSAAPTYTSAPVVTSITCTDTAANADIVEKNTTAATSGTTNASPLHEFQANYWTGAASAVDTWAIGSSLASGTNGASTLAITHPSGSTGAATLQVPTLTLEGSTGSCTFGAVGNGTEIDTTAQAIHFTLNSITIATTTASTNINLNPTGSVVINNNLAVNASGAITKYDGITTVSNGVPSELATVDLTGQVAAIGATTIYTPTATGMFRISAYLKITTAGTSPVLGPVTITYTDGTDSVAQSNVMLLATQAGAAATSNSGNSTTSTLNGSMVVWAKTGVAIQYAVALTGTVGTGAYEVHLKCEAL